MPRVSKSFDPAKRTLLRVLCCAPALCLAPAAFAADLVQTGTVTIEQVQIDFT